MIRTVYEDGYSWVEVDDEAWKHVQFTDYINGYEIPGN